MPNSILLLYKYLVDKKRTYYVIIKIGGVKMALIKCKKCGKEISSNSEKCIYCGEEVKIDEKTMPILNDYETENNIKSLNNISRILNIILIIGGIIFLIVSLTSDDDINVMLLAFSITCIIIGLVLPVFIKWMALMLKNIYELNRKGK